MLLLSCLLAFSCKRHSEKGIEFAIANRSGKPVAAVEVSAQIPEAAVYFDAIDADQLVTGFLSMEANTGDGSYTLRFTRSGKPEENLNAGYFTNGGPLDRRIEFEIQMDTVVVTYRSLLYVP